MPDTRVYILLPTYEPRMDFLQAAVESAIHQTEEQWTIHINDDASSMNVRAIIEPYLKDPRITFARNAYRLGIGGNWNACVRNSLSPRLPAGASAKEGERVRVRGSPRYVQFLFQDDVWAPRFLERACGILETHPSIGFVSVEHEYDCGEEIPTAPLYESLRAFRSAHITPGPNQGHALLDWWLSHSLHPNIIGEPSFVMLRRSLIERVGMFSEHMPQFLDVEYWTRCLAQTDWYFLKENLGTFRVHATGASERNRREGQGMTDRLLCTERAIRLLPKAMRSNHMDTLSRTLEDMIRKFQKERGQGNVSKNPLRFLPLLPFCLRHPLVVGKALFTKISSSAH